MADLSAKTGSGFDLLHNPTANYDLVLGTACATCCDSPCLCYDANGCPILKAYINPSYPNGDCTPDLACKCLTADDVDATDMPDVTVTITGSGVAQAIYDNGALKCAAPTYGCSWDGTFVVPCGTPSSWGKQIYVCTCYWYVGGSEGFRLVDVFYLMSVGVTFSAPNSGLNPSSITPATVQVSFNAGFRVWPASEAMAEVTSWHVCDGTIECGPPGFGTPGRQVQWTVQLSYLYKASTTFQTYLFDETNCPPVDCQPKTPLYDCSTLFILDPAYPIYGNGSSQYNGENTCYPLTSALSVGVSL